MDVAQESQPVVILSDNKASLYLQATRQLVWSIQGQTRMIRVNAGCTKANFYDTLNLLTGQELAMRANKMNATSNASTWIKFCERIPAQTFCCSGIVPRGIMERRFAAFWKRIHTWKY